MKTFLWTLLAVSLVVAPAAGSRADEAEASANKPVAVITIASYERLLTDLAFLGDVMGMPELDKQVEGGIELFTQGQGLEGFDKKRPLGIVLTTDGVQFQPLIMVPVTDMKKLLEAFVSLFGEPQEAGNGVLELDVFDQKIYAKEQGGYGCIAMSPDILAELPKQPATLLGDLGQTYDFALRLHMRDIPEPYREMLVEQLRLGVEAGLAREEDEGDEEFAARKRTTDQQIGLITTAVGQLEQLTLGATLDTATKKGQLDLQLVAAEGTEAARLFAQVHNGTSQFAGFIQPQAAASLNLTAKIAPQDTPPVVAVFRAFRDQSLQQFDVDGRLTDPNSRKLAKELADQVFDAIEQTIAGGTIDFGAALQLTDQSMSLVAGAHVDDPKSVEDALRRFATMAEKNAAFAGIKFDADAHQDVRFHTTAIAVPQDQPIAKALGQQLDVAVGVGQQSVYLVLGSEGVALCKSLIDKSKAEAREVVPAMRLNLSLAPIFKFAAAMQPEAGAVEMADQLAAVEGKDHVQVVVMPRGNSMTFRVEAEEGVIRILARALQQAGAASLQGLAPPTPAEACP